MNDPEPTIRINIELLDDAPVTEAEMKLLADLLPELLKDLLSAQDDKEE